jgi:transcriptional regulator with XRE-family HTH domain
MANTVGPLIRKARSDAGFTQEQLAKKVTGLSASDISRAERGELIPTQEQLKMIAKVTGVTQKSLLDAAKESKTDSTSTGKNDSKTMEVTSTERKLVELYRKASTDEKKTVMSILKGEKDTTNEMISSLLDGSKKPADIVSSILGSAVESFAKKK